MAGRDILTRNQLLVLEKLEAAGGPLSAYTLLDLLREQTVSARRCRSTGRSTR